MNRTVLTNIKHELEFIRPKDGPKAAEYVDLFDEFLREEEFGLALHSSCDFWLEPSTSSVDPSIVKIIEHLHQVMKINDDCVQKLMTKSKHSAI